MIGTTSASRRPDCPLYASVCQSLKASWPLLQACSTVPSGFLALFLPFLCSSKPLILFFMTIPFWSMYLQFGILNGPDVLPPARVLEDPLPVDGVSTVALVDDVAIVGPLDVLAAVDDNGGVLPAVGHCGPWLARRWPEKVREAYGHCGHGQAKKHVPGPHASLVEVLM